jgi:hypothetical protein
MTKHGEMQAKIVSGKRPVDAQLALGLSQIFDSHCRREECPSKWFFRRQAFRQPHNRLAADLQRQRSQNG